LSPHSIKPTDVGKRITVQYFDDDGTRHEVVGMFERAEIRDGEPILHVRRGDDSVVAVRNGRIKAGRVVSPR
jgi:hypothetical protein